MFGEILWLDSGDTIIRGTGMQIQYNYVTMNRALFLDNFFDYFMHMSRPFAPVYQLKDIMVDYAEE